MLYLFIDGDEVGIFNDPSAIMPLLESGLQPIIKGEMFSEIEQKIRMELSFDQLYDLGWEDEMAPVCLNAWHNRKIATGNQMLKRIW